MSPILSNEEIIGFAQMVVKVLDLQREYFRGNRDLLPKCREAETELRKTALNVISLAELTPCHSVIHLVETFERTLFDASPVPRLPD